MKFVLEHLTLDLMLLLLHIPRYLSYMSATFLSFLKATTTRNPTFFVFCCCCGFCCCCVCCVFFWVGVTCHFFCFADWVLAKFTRRDAWYVSKTCLFICKYIFVLFYILGPAWLCLHCFYVFSFSINLLAHCGWKTHQTLFCANNSGLEISPCSFRYFSTVHLQ